MDFTSELITLKSQLEVLKEKKIRYEELYKVEKQKMTVLEQRLAEYNINPIQLDVIIKAEEAEIEQQITDLKVQITKAQQQYKELENNLAEIN